MASRPARKSNDRRPKAPRLRPVEDGSVRVESPTAVAAEALRTGILPPHVRRRQSIPREDDILVGDPDDRALANEYVGEDTPGASTPTPDQNGVDEIGRAYGLQEEDTGVLRSAAEVLDRRDRHRSELLPPSRRQR